MMPFLRLSLDKKLCQHDAIILSNNINFDKYMSRYDKILHLRKFIRAIIGVSKFLIHFFIKEKAECVIDKPSVIFLSRSVIHYQLQEIIENSVYILNGPYNHAILMKFSKFSKFFCLFCCMSYLCEIGCM